MHHAHRSISGAALVLVRILLAAAFALNLHTMVSSERSTLKREFYVHFTKVSSIKIGNHEAAFAHTLRNMILPCAWLTHISVQISVTSLSVLHAVVLVLSFSHSHKLVVAAIHKI